MTIRSINRRTFLCLATLAWSVSLLGCSPEMRQTWKDISTLQETLQTEYPEDQVQVQLWNGDSLSISFLNSDFSELPDTERKDKAKEIALFAHEHYPGEVSLSAVTVTFTIHKKYFGLVSYTNSLDSHRFHVDELNLNY